MRERIRQLLRQWAPTLISAALAALGVRWGIAPPDVHLFPPICPPTTPAPPVPPGDTPIPIPPAPPNPPAPPPEKTPNTLAAMVRLSGRGAGCSGTVIGPRRSDGRYWVLTAAHCVRAGGERWTMTFRDGRKADMTVTNTDDTSDCAWGITDRDYGELPFALLADKSPTGGETVWHSGFGVNRPGNRETGEVIGRADRNNQLAFTLAVSSGDSGGGVALSGSDRIVSVVCCTVGGFRNVETRGASVEAMVKARKE